ncbi:MAG: hypothetical protein WCK27_19720 [Verrucomicrobiota bacterium]
MRNDSMQRPVRGVKLPSLVFCVALLAVWLPAGGQAQVNSGSNGSDGAFNPATNVVINMADHPNGIYQYTSVNVSNGVTVTFIPNANNSPVTWLVQGDCTIAGNMSVSGGDTIRTVAGAQGGPGGWSGGNAALSPVLLPGAGVGPGGGTVGTDPTYYGGNASYATAGGWNTNLPSGDSYRHPQFPPGPMYGNIFTLPLLGGSGGSGGRDMGGGGGGGALLIAASGTLSVSGSILARGGNGAIQCWAANIGTYYDGTAGAGSGGAIRLVATTVSGGGTLDANGGQAQFGTWNSGWNWGTYLNSAGNGRIRLDGLNITFNGPTTGVFTSGFQPIIVPQTNQIAGIVIQSIAGVAVSPSPSGVLTTPDAVIPAQQGSPVPVVVHCSNLPMNTPITVTVVPANGSAVSAVGYNNTGTQSASSATVLVAMPRGGGRIYAAVAAGS